MHQWTSLPLFQPITPLDVPNNEWHPNLTIMILSGPDVVGKLIGGCWSGHFLWSRTSGTLTFGAMEMWGIAALVYVLKGWSFLLLELTATPMSMIVSLLWIVNSELDRLIVVDMDMFVMFEHERLNSLLISLNRGSFDVIVGMDWLSKRKFVIVCHEKVVRIPLEGDEILRVHGERTQGVVKNLSEHKEEKHGVHLKLVLELLRKEKLYAKFTKSEAVKNWEVPTTPSEI
ncbi:hypothetical protein Tco_0650223 [Tanacetum coccineum]